MSLVLVDSSIWIEYFRNPQSKISTDLEKLIDTDLVCTNDLILAELLPFFFSKKQKSLVESFRSMQRIPLNIQWEDIVDIQLTNMRNGINKVGIPDLIIAQNSIQAKIPIFTLDKHFQLMHEKAKIPILLYLSNS